VLPGATIGKHTVIGAGSVVSGEIPDFSVAVGNPARVIRRYVLGEGWVRVDDARDEDDPGPAYLAGDG
jgi:serine acetyltransferase